MLVVRQWHVRLFVLRFDARHNINSATSSGRKILAMARQMGIRKKKKSHLTLFSRSCSTLAPKVNSTVQCPSERDMVGRGREAKLSRQKTIGRLLSICHFVTVWEHESRKRRKFSKGYGEGGLVIPHALCSCVDVARGPWPVARSPGDEDACRDRMRSSFRDEAPLCSPSLRSRSTYVPTS
ncbi:hypothetical protein BS50DRAFT_160282 [Corynespora cassiicola Philippines]|uniref:Uncharacterized protein n=1 Tax=Corynespora cassiicola Philippines TaxID=1448308 RepID=A0A2T2N7D4_CORCC|nr:hypothetical protein BS50DRAFT_160282 [Corynespora cassiicola Philippines]